MSFGKLTLLSADCLGSGAMVGSSRMVADSSGTWGAPGAGDFAAAGFAAGGFAAGGVVPGGFVEGGFAGGDSAATATDWIPGPAAGATSFTADCRLPSSAARDCNTPAPPQTTPMEARTPMARRIMKAISVCWFG